MAEGTVATWKFRRDTHVQSVTLPDLSPPHAKTDCKILTDGDWFP